jgi:hypothetical protein
MPELPERVRAYVERAVPRDAATPRAVRITQRGEMWTKPGASPRRFKAEQRFAVDAVAFSWQARFRIFGPLALKVVDEYAAGEGSLRVRLLGRTLQHEHDRTVAIGEAYRYLAELPWVPYAMTANAELEWRGLDASSVEVSTQVGDERVALTVEFDEGGDVARIDSPSRPRLVEGRVETAAWGGEFADYDVLGGMRMPTRAEVWWELPEGRFVYWRGRVTNARPAT